VPGARREDVPEIDYEALVKESYEELLRVTKAAAEIEQQAGELRERAAALSYRIQLLTKSDA
jgi:hypothetical protein